MRYLLTILILLPAMVYAQDDWGPATDIFSDLRWPFMDSAGVLYGFESPSISWNDSLLFFIPWCFNSHPVVYSVYAEDAWQNPSAIPDTITGDYVSSLFFHDQDSTLYFKSNRYPLGRTRMRDGIWQPAESLSNYTYLTGAETDPSLPEDGSRLYFNRNGTIMYSDIINGEFNEPVALPEVINSPDSNESCPRISLDGRKLYFNRCQGFYCQDKLRVSEYLNGQWQIPMVVDNDINFGGPAPDCWGRFGTSLLPSFSLNDTKMYFEYASYYTQLCEPGFGIMVSELLSGVSDDEDNTPSQFSLSAYPNPFNAEISINISGNISQLSNLSIYNISGQKVRSMPIGPNIIWDGRDEGRNDVASGIYFVRAAGDGISRTIKVALVR